MSRRDRRGRRGLSAALSGEVLKARRGLVAVLTFVVLALAAGVAALFMFVIADPERARGLGLLQQKAELSGLTADWAGLISFADQIGAVGGLLIYSFIATWLFGREFVEGTARYLMALPVARRSIVMAKLIVLIVWSGLLAVWLAMLMLLVGAGMSLPGWDGPAVADAVWRLLATMILTCLVVLPVAYVASRARGYLAPLGTALGLVVIGQVAAALGWGAVVPWSAPAVFAGVAPGQVAGVGSVLICLLTGVIGAWATVRWWDSADAGR